MSLNHAELNLILEELNLPGSFIQNIIQPSYDTIALYLYKQAAADTPGGISKTLLVCLAPGVCRLHETDRKIPKNDKPLRFMEFLRSRIKGARILEAVQLHNDRIVRLTLSRGEETFYLYIRLWSGAGNIIVTDENHTILDVFFRRPKRNEITGEYWDPPLPPENAPEHRYSIRELPVSGELSFNEKIDQWYGTHAKTLSREALLEEARRRYETSRSRLEAALERLEKKRQSFLHADRFRHQGDLLTANLWMIKQGMTSIEVTDYESADGGTALVRIELDPRLKPQENAAKYYEQYKKAVSGLSELEDDIAAARATLEKLTEEFESLEKEENPLVIQKKLRRQNTPKQQIEKRYPGLVFRRDGWTFLVGRTASENDELLRRHVKGLDMWLHTRDWPGSYVFIKNRPGKTVPLDILLDAGTLALFYSKGRKAGTGDLYYTQVKHLRRAKNAPRGTVLPSNEKNLTVSLEQDRLKRLESCRESL
ncbi:NFACT family protein [Brucepastera parasyntrophica]|uniref:NFACT RNA binding domain-containing protein n=1 Tax=Brucepastera parasyntrophica TaxID=2880008 RepID=UPI00210C3532|nr:NFACT family protein [Brucepastera parasyntrophica]ULQ60541.1 NFACT family protein [Brucepastera parasyntrophica]